MASGDLVFDEASRPGWRAMAGETCENFESSGDDAAAVWARSIGGSALVGLLLEQAPRISLMDC